jgi:DNA uptake protein ComE-like DNA-binding protein
MWKDFFYFSKRERQGILILIVLIAGIFIGKFLFTPKTQHFSEEITSVNETENSLSKNSFSVDSPEKPNVSEKPKTEYKQKFRTSPQKSTLPEEKRTYYSPPEKTPEPPLKNLHPKQEKYAAGTSIELNASDTSQLKMIPGIGSSFAKRIVSYRNLLGGYYKLQQLQETYGMYEELYEKITPYLRVDSSLIVPIQTNSVSLDRLKAHPYLNFYQAKAIVEIRKKKGKIDSINELELLEEFTADDLGKIKHYLSF